ncbi:MAG: prephenate dehydratase [Alphaproteobacteria bacterium]|jgi:prephenate dehydratase|nr:prephenate dehydratase [Alphaproteobacteria bacterium]
MNTKIFSFQGVHGAYSELAGKNIYPDSKSIPCKTFEEMFESVLDKKANIAIVPIENSRSGRVGDTQRLIPESQLKIVGEYFLEVNHCLMGVPGSTLKDIKRIYSHEQGIAQCRKKIINNKKDMVIVADTAGAAKMISETNSKEDAAIASNLAAKIYNLDILESSFQDFENNVTRFLIMSNELNIPKVNEIDLITTLVFEVRSIPAALYKSLGGLASNGVNMTKLESYINPQGFDVAQFYMDIEGHPNNRNVKLALEEMKFFCKHIDILGVYKMSDFRKK